MTRTKEVIDMKKFTAIVLVSTSIILFFGCNLLSACNKADVCEHDWARAENENEYTAVDTCSLCGQTRRYTDPAGITYSGSQVGFRLLRYDWTGDGIGQKNVSACDLADAIIDCLSKLKETGEIIPKISDDAVNESTGQLPVNPGTLWIECGSVGLFRLNPEMTEICKAEAHLAEGKVLQMTDTLKELLKQAWFFYPNDCWSGEYKNGNVTLEQVFKSDSVVDSVRIDRIQIENSPDSVNKITLYIRANESKKARIELQSQQSADTIGLGDAKEMRLTKNKETKVELTFGGFTDTRYVTIRIDNTRINLTITP